MVQMTRQNKISRPIAPAIKEKKRILVISEGAVSEPNYLRDIYGLRSNNNQIDLTIIQHRTKNSVSQLVSRLQKFLEESPVEKNDEAWIVVDVDNRHKNDFKELFIWHNQRKYHKVAISNPNIEYWFLLHFEPGDSIGTVNECLTRLQSGIKKANNQKSIEYKKRLFPKFITLQRVKQAIKRAQNRDPKPHEVWPSFFCLNQNIFVSSKADLETIGV